MEKRKAEFIKYHMYGDGDCNGQVLRAYAEQNGLTENDKADLTYFYATTYCCASAAYMLEHREDIRKDAKGFSERCKQQLIFQSDRKYVRMLDNLYKMLVNWRDLLSRRWKAFHGQVVNRGVVNVRAALEIVEKWYFFSRFSAYLFVETYCDIFGYAATRVNGLDYEGDSMTFAGGLFYVFNMDSDAEYIQKHHKLPVDVETFEYLLAELQNAVSAAGGDENLTKLETSLCAYEKFFKGTRYNGYYADRQLQELTKMRQDPELWNACEAVYRARKAAIPVKYRGEDNGWEGVRPELKKLYRETGRIIGFGN